MAATEREALSQQRVDSLASQLAHANSLTSQIPSQRPEQHLGQVGLTGQIRPGDGDKPSQGGTVGREEGTVQAASLPEAGAYSQGANEMGPATRPPRSRRSSMAGS
jgi:hypothetical protein